MTRNLMYVLVIVLSLNAQAQEKSNDLAAITTTINNYFDGYVNRDIVKLNAAFDIKNGTMKVPVAVDGVITEYQNNYFKDLMPVWGSRAKLPQETLNNSALIILNTDIVNSTMASAKISMKVGEVVYIDILGLQKINGVWKITNKYFIVAQGG